MAFNPVKELKHALSYVIFEKILGRPSASQIASEVVKKTNVWNSNRGSPRCYNCSHQKVVSDVSGNSGFFSTPHHFYRCSSCGNAQSSDGRYSFRYEHQELRDTGIIKDNERFRYRLLSGGWVFLFYMTAFAFAIGGLMYFPIYLEWSFLRSISASFVPLILFIIFMLN